MKMGQAKLPGATGRCKSRPPVQLMEASRQTAQHTGSSAQSHTYWHLVANSAKCFLWAQTSTQKMGRELRHQLPLLLRNALRAARKTRKKLVEGNPPSVHPALISIKQGCYERFPNCDWKEPTEPSEDRFCNTLPSVPPNLPFSHIRTLSLMSSAAFCLYWWKSFSLPGNKG